MSKRLSNIVLSNVPYKSIEVARMAVPRALGTFNIETDDSFDDGSGNIINLEAPSVNAVFSDTPGKPMFTYKNTKSKSRKVGNRVYYNDTLLFWEEVNRIMEGRSLKQKLGDVSTDYILSRFDDETYADFFMKFYKPLAAELEKYAISQGLQVPEDIALFYKGGNLFRVILTDFAAYLNNKQFMNLLKKRSDADFQIFINPSIKPASKYKEVCDEVSKRVLVALYKFKAPLSASSLLDVDATALAHAYGQVLNEGRAGQFRITDVISQPFRSDFIMGKVATAAKPTIGYRESYCLLKGFEKSRADNPSLYISRNLASDFTTFSKKRYLFELIRLKKNIKLKVAINKEGHETTLQTTLQVPSEVIDVSIPKKGDHSLDVMRGNTAMLLQEFRYKSMTFFGTSLDYMLYDLTDILFLKFEWPWLDAKYKKRIDRYFLCLLIACVRDLSPDDMVADLIATRGIIHNTHLPLPNYKYLRLFVQQHQSILGDTSRRTERPLDKSQHTEYTKHVHVLLDALVDAALHIKQQTDAGDQTVHKIVEKLFKLREVMRVGGKRK